MTNAVGHAPATLLTSEEIEKVRERAAREAGRFVDPLRLYRVQGWWRHDLGEWAAAITGREHPVGLLRDLRWDELVLIDLAHELEPTPPPPPALTAQRAAAEAEREQRERAREARRQAALDEWDALREALPVPASIAFNFSRHTYELHQHGTDHIVVWADLQVGRLRRRAGQALCATPSRSRGLHLDNAELERERQETGRERKHPGCKTCIATAKRITARSKETPK
jgi:hypothetical protein